MIDNPQLKLAHDYVQWTGENVFLVRDGTLCTPPLHTILDGLTRPRRA